ncbi:MAG: hypothetical protein R3C12_18570 [Planctomycetaceae bacterium]
MNRYHDDCRKWLIEFGISPAARSRMRIAVDKQKTNGKWGRDFAGGGIILSENPFAPDVASVMSGALALAKTFSGSLNTNKYRFSESASRETMPLMLFVLLLLCRDSHSLEHIEHMETVVFGDDKVSEFIRNVVSVFLSAIVGIPAGMWLNRIVEDRRRKKTERIEFLKSLSRMIGEAIEHRRNGRLHR